MAWGILSKSDILANNKQEQTEETGLVDTSGTIPSTIITEPAKDTLKTLITAIPDPLVEEKKTTTSKKQEPVKYNPVPSPQSQTAKIETKNEAKTETIIPSLKDEKKEPVKKQEDPPPPIIISPAKTEPSNPVKLSQTATIVKGTVLLAKSSTTISSDDGMALPRRVTFTLDKAVLNGQHVICPSGSIIMAKITNVRNSDQKRAGVIDIVFEYLQAPDGQKIPLYTNEFHLVAKGDIPMEITSKTIYKIATSSTLQINY